MFRNSFGLLTDPQGFRKHWSDAQCEAFYEAVLGVCSELTLDMSIAESWWTLLGRGSTSERVLIGELRSVVDDVAFVDKLEKALERRATRIASQVAPFIEGRRVLDWGCGDGLVASRLRGSFNFELLDIEDQRKASRSDPFHLYDERVVPTSMKGERYDTVLVSTVLHHSLNPARCIKHICEVGSRAVVIESVPEIEHPSFALCQSPWAVDQLRYEYCGFVDWFYNRVLCEDVQVTYNYLPTVGWNTLWEACGFTCKHQEVLGVDQPLVPEWHVLLVYSPDA